MTTVAEHIITSLADAGVTQVWGVVGDALNPLTDAIRTEDRIEWVGVRHEEVAAFAVSAQAQLTGTLGVCMGTVGPGSIHLLNGLYDAKKSHAPVLAICGQVPSPEIGTDFFQEVDNNALFADVSVWSQTLTLGGTAALPARAGRQRGTVAARRRRADAARATSVTSRSTRACGPRRSHRPACRRRHRTPRSTPPSPPSRETRP